MIAPFQYSVFTVKRVFKNQTSFTEKEKLTEITTSSLEAKPGALFIPLIGNRDGHDYIKDALTRGATAFLCQKGHPILQKLDSTESKKAILVEDTFTALGILAQYHRRRFHPLVIGITGSSGKTTVKDLLFSVCQKFGPSHIVVTEKNYNNEIGVPFTLFRINETTRIVICEMGMNHKGELSRISRMTSPEMAIITGIGPAHIEFFKTTTAIAAAKAEIMDGMPGGSRLYFPADILHKKDLLNKAKKRAIKTTSYSVENSGIEIIKFRRDGFELGFGGNKFLWKMPGERLLINLAGVTILARDAGLATEQIVNGVRNFKPADLRLNIIKNYYTIINDCYNANPDSMASSLNVLCQFAGSQKKYAILGDMKELGNKSRHYHETIGKLAARLQLDGLVTFGKDAKYILKKYRKHKGEKKPDIALHYKDSDKNIKKLLEEMLQTAPADSVILVKGSRSLKMERVAEMIRDVIANYANH